LEAKVKERTEELEQAYESLKESEKSLAEAQKMAHIGNWEWDIAADKAYWSEEMYHIFDRNPQELAPSFSEYLNYIHPDDLDYYCNSLKKAANESTFGIDYRIIRATGEERILHLKSEFVLDNKSIPIKIKGIVQDITERKKAEEDLAKMEKIRIKEIHHRIKNNLQVISSLLDLQVGKFSHLEVCKVSEVIEAFTESQNRVISMALIHEELYKGNNLDTLDFAAYLKKLTENLFLLYDSENKDINLKLDFEQVYLGMDTAIPLGIIVNELISNSFKHAFPAGRKGEIEVKLSRTENLATKNEISGLDKDFKEKNSFGYVLKVSDNGKGIPQEIDLENVGSLGLQLVNILVKQLEGVLEIKSNTGTEFNIWFND
jgi:PAS domain S-box-containing protein